jgi:transposase
MSTRFYDTDLTDAAWAFVAPVLPSARPGGRPRTTNLRAVLNAIFYLLLLHARFDWIPSRIASAPSSAHQGCQFVCCGPNAWS